MSKIQRVQTIIIAVFIIAASIFMMLITPDSALNIMAGILSISLFIYGVRRLIYYFSMARHMVGGRLMLYLGIVIFDFGMLTLMMASIPRFYIALYLIAVFAFSGIIDVARSLETMLFRSSSWKFRLFSGLISIAVAILCIVYINSADMLVYFYCAGLIYSAVARIITAFRKTEIVYIQ
ncbi:MAG: hypothetical protein IIZ23_06345 [Ruminococcus sp.]|nr:hypothetical protein [Ruminococcus sp.]